MSLNDVYSQKYTPTPKTEALEYIDSVLHEAEEKMRRQLGAQSRGLRIWKEIHDKLASGAWSEMGKYNESIANTNLQRNRLPLLEDDYEPSEDNLVRWRLRHVKLNLDYNLLSAIRDACGEN